MYQNVNQYIQAHKDRFLEELFEFLRIPSVSASSERQDDVRKAAEFVQKTLEKAGMEKVDIYETAGNPIVYAERIIDESKPTVLVYGHYDVQPTDPEEEWEHAPFAPYIDEQNNIRARGASDDKGQLFMHMKALEFLNRYNELPCNIKCIFEGEEEIGSPHIENFARENADMLAADVLLVSDTGMVSNEQPSIPIGLRGITYLELTVKGPNKDLHSGLYGGAVANPANTLATLIGSLKDEQGFVTVPGFYDRVQPPSAQEREKLKDIPVYDEDYKRELRVTELGGEAGYSAYEGTAVRPTLDVNGMWSGYIGEGAKTVLPSEAHAKISMRLVPDQDPDEIHNLVSQYLQEKTPRSVQLTVHSLHGAVPLAVSTESAEYQAASRAYRDTFGVEPIPVRSGGSIPVVTFFAKEMHMTPILMGFGLESDGAHSSNEKLGVFNFLKGIETIPLFYKHLVK